jgi:AAA+ superfamily predicted ATPase
MINLNSVTIVSIDLRSVETIHQAYKHNVTIDHVVGQTTKKQNIACVLQSFLEKN